MPIDPRCFILFGCNVLLFFLSQLVNSSLAGWSLHMVLLGPMLVLPSLYLRHTDFFLCLLLTGLWVDAAYPIPYGFFTTGFLVLGTILFGIRHRFRAEHNYHPILIAHSVNFATLLLLAFAMGQGTLTAPSYWIQAVATSLLSHLTLLVVAPWFFNFERMLFSLLHVDTEPEDLPIH